MTVCCHLVTYCDQESHVRQQRVGSVIHLDVDVLPQTHEPIIMSVDMDPTVALH